ncbi:MAG: peptide MFS transporter [Bacteroidota bacterium]|nr:peptide MFS transporter [Bacteroidota bacterium]MDP4213252.1 peptide MFS transporter [Bacteroidota bacterium]MDP4250335.1 peptide MFS transporter [Bacteroidota bacterium]
MNTALPQKGHPRGLYVLFFTEMWERFGYYLMVGILFLFLHDTVNNGGRGLDTGLAADIVGTYIALVYLTPFIGGLIADRYIGYRVSVFLGGSLMALGYFLMSVPHSGVLLYAALGSVIIGNGFFKPNISTLLGNIYNKEELKPKKDIAYNIFYMGINIGALVCNFVAAFLRINYSWGYAFAAAGFGMVISLIFFASGQKYVKHADVIKPVQKEDMPLSKIVSYVFLPAIAAGIIGWFIPGNLMGSDSNDAFIFACIPIIIFYFNIWRRCDKPDRRRIGALFTLFGVSIIFWNIYNQNATSLTIWADNYTKREAPAAIEKIIKPFGFLQTVNTKEKEVPVLDEHFHAKTGAKGNVVTHIGTDPYLQNIPKGEWPAPGEDLKLISTEIYQSINPFWIIVLTPIIVGLFGFLKARNRELSTPGKFAWGTIIAGLSSVVMVIAALSTNIYEHKVSSAWIIGSYGVFTISELFVSPVGLSLVSKVSPRRFTALMMGGWFITTSLGAKIAGIMAGFWDNFDSKALFFGISATAAIVAGLLLFPLTKKLNKIVLEATAADE